MPDFPGSPPYGTPAWPFVEPAAPNPYAGGSIDSIPGRLALAGADAPAADTTPPAVTNFDPPDGSRLATRESPIAFDVSDAGGFSLVIVSVLYPGGVEVVAHDGVNFQGPFAGGSSRAAITNGWRYTLRHSGGWPSAPTVRVHPVDASGNTV